MQIRFQRTLLAALLAGSAWTAPALAQDRPDLVVAVNDVPGTLESAEELGNVAVRIQYSMFDSLIRRDFLADGSGAASELVPGLAESWEQIDETTWEFELREGVLFHNGDELTSQDVAFTFTHGRILGENGVIQQAKRFVAAISHVDPIDRYTVRIHTNDPDPVFEQRMAGYAVQIVNAREYLLKGKDGFARDPVGTGPYMLDEFVDGESIRLIAHDDYFGGRPTAESITFQVVPEVSARIAGLVSGEYDISVNIPPDQIPTVERYDDLKVERIVLDNTHMLVFYQDAPFMQDKKVRQALSMAIDRDLLRQALWNDENFTPNGHQLPSYDIYVEDFPEFPYDPERAKELLAESSYDGETVTYRLPLNYYLNSLEAAQAIQQMWEAVGFNVSLEPRENWTLARAEGTNVRPWSNTHRMPDPMGSFVPQWGRLSWVQNDRDDPARSWVAPERFNELQDTIATATDPAVRQEAYREALELWVDEAPGTMLYNPLETYALRDEINWKPYSLYYMDFRPYNLSFD